MSDTSGRIAGRRAVVDAHVHLFDHTANRHEFLERRDEFFEALVGDYSTLPRTYLLDDYLRDSGSRRVEGIVWHEFLSEDPVREARWGQALADRSPIPQAIVARIDFRDPALAERLEAYRALANVTAVREHLGWDPVNPLRRFAPGADLLTDPAWRAGISRLRGWDVACGLEVFAHQLPEMLDVVRREREIRFTLSVMGWPLDLTAEGRERWGQTVAELSRCENVCASVSAVECVLGMNWTLDAARPWIQTLIDRFGPDRCMLGSHLPMSRLSRGFEPLYDAYEELVVELSPGEQDDLFRGTATRWFGLAHVPEIRGQSFVGTERARLHGSHRDSEPLGDLGVRQSFEVL
jgi:predicted TIM-barrel fold metal-dependent hydrolase